MLVSGCLDAVDGEDELIVERLLDPQRAVIVEGAMRSAGAT